jgi:MFS family permease
MVQQFDIVHRESEVAFYLGILSSSFFAARGISNPFWGWFSDRLGRRRPILLLGTLGGMIGYVLFGLSKSFTWVRSFGCCNKADGKAICAQLFVALIDANLGMVNAIIGELSNKSNQSAAFSFIPVFQGLGAILGVITGGLLAYPTEKLPWLFGESEFLHQYPYFPL